MTLLMINDIDTSFPFPSLPLYNEDGDSFKGELERSENRAHSFLGLAQYLCLIRLQE